MQSLRKNRNVLCFNSANWIFSSVELVTPLTTLSDFSFSLDCKHSTTTLLLLLTSSTSNSNIKF